MEPDKPKFWTDTREGDADVLTARVEHTLALTSDSLTDKQRRLVREIFFAILPLINMKYATHDPRHDPPTPEPEGENPYGR